MVQILGSSLASCWWLAASSCLARLAIWYSKAPGLGPGARRLVFRGPSWLTIKTWDVTIKKWGLKHQNMLFFHDLHWFIIYNPKKGIWDDLTIKHGFFYPQTLMWSRTGPTNHGKSTGCIPRGCPTTWVYHSISPKSGSLALLMEKWRWTTILFMAKWLETPLDLGVPQFQIWLWINTY